MRRSLSESLTIACWHRYVGSPKRARNNHSINEIVCNYDFLIQSMHRNTHRSTQTLCIRFRLIDFLFLFLFLFLLFFSCWFISSFSISKYKTTYVLCTHGMPFVEYRYAKINKENEKFHRACESLSQSCDCRQRWPSSIRAILQTMTDVTCRSTFHYAIFAFYRKIIYLCRCGVCGDNRRQLSIISRHEFLISKCMCRRWRK